MAIITGFFDSTNEEEPEHIYTAGDMANVLYQICGGRNGVVGDCLKVTESEEGGFSVKVNTGICFINGYWFCLTKEIELNLSYPSSVSSTRIDAVVVTLNTSDRLLDIGIDYDVGDRTADGNSLVLAHIYVSSTSVVDSMIVDLRADDAYCGQLFYNELEELTEDELITILNA